MAKPRAKFFVKPRTEYSAKSSSGPRSRFPIVKAKPQFKSELPAIIYDDRDVFDALFTFFSKNLPARKDLNIILGFNDKTLEFALLKEKLLKQRFASILS